MFFAIQSYAVSTKGVLKDSVITAKVKSKIALDSGLSVFKIEVKTHHGVVHLAGVVNSETDADALIQLTQSTDGVKDVNTYKLKAKASKKLVRDTAITAKVKGMYIREKLMGTEVSPIGVHVETTNGVVYLSGTVDNEIEKTNAVKLAKSVKGVKKVQSRIETTSEEE